MPVKRHVREEKKQHHLWGVYANGNKTSDAGGVFTRMYKNTWHYIKPCTNDRRAIIKINTKLYSQLEVREENTGFTVLTFSLKEQ